MAGPAMASKGAVTIQTFGSKYKLRAVWIAPGTPTRLAYRLSKTYRR